MLALEATDISYGSVAAADVDVAPPAGAKVVDLGSPASGTPGDGNAHAGDRPRRRPGRRGFPVVAPDTLVGLPRQDVRLVGGRGLADGARRLRPGPRRDRRVERKAGRAEPAGGGPLSSLPTVSLDGVTAHELATQLGTVLEWERGGVAYVLAGSLPPAAAEAAARSLG